MSVERSTIWGAVEGFGGVQKSWAMVWALVVLALVYGMAHAWYAAANLDTLNWLNAHPKYLTDDSYYYFVIAKNFAAGLFSTADGGVTQTNGYHPVWTFALIPVYLLFDPENVIEAIKVVEIILLAVSAAFLILAAKAFRLSPLPMIPVLPALYTMPGLNMGMESAIALCSISALITVAGVYVQNSTRLAWLWVYGVLATIPLWTRLEFVFLSVGITVITFLVVTRDVQGWRGRLTMAGIFPVAAPVVSLLLYAAYNYALFGIAIPVSGAAKLTIAGGRVDVLLNLGTFIRHPQFLFPAMGVLISLACLWAAWRIFKKRSDLDSGLLLTFVSIVVFVFVTHFARWTLSILTLISDLAFVPWYFTPGYLGMALLCPTFTYTILSQVSKGSDERRKLNPAIVSLTIMSLLIVVFGIYYPFQRVDAARENTRMGVPGLRYEGTKVMDDILSDGTVVGAWGSGVIMYYSEHTVINLDGLVNSHEYLKARTAGAAWEDTYKHFGITHIAKLNDTVKGSELIYQGEPLREGSGIAFRLWSVK